MLGCVMHSRSELAEKARYNNLLKKSSQQNKIVLSIFLSRISFCEFQHTCLKNRQKWLESQESEPAGNLPMVLEQPLYCTMEREKCKEKEKTLKSLEKKRQQGYLHL